MASCFGGQAGAYTYKILYAFCQSTACTDGAYPTGRLVLYQGNLYGTTLGGGGAMGKGGTVFQLSFKAKKKQWTYKPLYSFCVDDPCSDGTTPAGIIVDGAGNIFGSTRSGGANGHGTIFELTPAGKGYTHQILYNFCPPGQTFTCEDGDSPNGRLAIDSETGNIFGSAANGGASDAAAGVVFELRPDKNSPSGWREAPIYSFCADGGCSSGGSPSDIAMDSSGTILVSTGRYGSVYSGGSVFRLKPNKKRTAWTPQTLYVFCKTQNSLGTCPDGNIPQAVVTPGDDGVIFGSTTFGGHLNEGVIFRLTPNAKQNAYTYDVIKQFCYDQNCSKGGGPEPGALVFDPKTGNLYGTLESFGPENAGVVYRLKPNADASSYSQAVLHGFPDPNCACTDGGNPMAVIMDEAGNFFGVAGYGQNDAGIVFELEK